MKKLKKKVKKKLDKIKFNSVGVAKEVAGKMNPKKVGRVKRKALSFMLAKGAKTLGMKIDRKDVEKVFSGKAEEVDEVTLTSIGILIKKFVQKDLNVPLFVKECKEGIYRKDW